MAVIPSAWCMGGEGGELVGAAGTASRGEMGERHVQPLLVSTHISSQVPYGSPAGLPSSLQGMHSLTAN